MISVCENNVAPSIFLNCAFALHTPFLLSPLNLFPYLVTVGPPQPLLQSPACVERHLVHSLTQTHKHKHTLSGFPRPIRCSWPVLGATCCWSEVGSTHCKEATLLKRESWEEWTEVRWRKLIEVDLSGRTIVVKRQ